MQFNFKKCVSVKYKEWFKNQTFSNRNFYSNLYAQHNIVYIFVCKFLSLVCKNIFRKDVGPISRL